MVKYKVNAAAADIETLLGGHLRQTALWNLFFWSCLLRRHSQRHILEGKLR